MTLDRWYLENLRCPVDRGPLEQRDDVLVSSSGRRYPVVDGVPVMLVDEAEPTLWVARASAERARTGKADERAPELYLESLGVSPEDRTNIAELARKGPTEIDPVVAYMVLYTSGNTYQGLMGKLTRYPIPEIRIPDSNGESLLDVGCNWGRWSIAAAKKGYSVVGIDPSLGGVMAARRVSRQLGLSIRFVVGDGRYLPFADAIFDWTFCFGVLQHLSKENAKMVLTSMARVLRPGGSPGQMAHWSPSVAAASETGLSRSTSLRGEALGDRGAEEDVHADRRTEPDLGRLLLRSGAAER
jgi:SAM-dependent methyltransferase